MGLAMGTYAIVPALDVHKAVDVVGDVDNRSANVYVNNWALDDGQFWFVWGASRAGYPTGDYRTITCSLSGKALDVEVHGSLKSEQNVVQYDPSTSPAQAWLPVADGKSVTFTDRKSYPTYVIRCAADENLALDVQYAITSGNTNVWVYTRNGTDAQRFIFIPVPTLPNGYYSIRTVMDQSRCLDIENASQGDGANCMVYSYHGGPNQIFVANTEFSGDRAGMTTLRACHSNKYLSTDSEDNVPGLNVRQWRMDGSPTKLWLAQRYSSVNRNGVDVPTYLFRHRNQAGWLMDVAGGRTELLTNVQVWPGNGSAAQQFELYPDLVFNPNLAMPAGFCLRYPTSYWNPKGRDQTGPWGNEGSGSHDNGDGSWTTNFALSFTSGGELMQIRYRVTYEEAITGSRRRTAWMNPADSANSNDGLSYSTTNDGWGYNWRPNVRMVRDGSRWVTPFTIPFTVGNRVGQNRRLVIELEAYTYGDNYHEGAYSGPSHSHLYSATCSINYAPHTVVSGAVLHGWGIGFATSNDWPVDGVSCSIAPRFWEHTVADKVTKSWNKRSDVFAVSADRLRYIPPEQWLSAKTSTTSPYGNVRDWSSDSIPFEYDKEVLDCNVELDESNYTFAVNVKAESVTSNTYVLSLSDVDERGGRKVLGSVPVKTNGPVKDGYMKVATIFPIIGNKMFYFIGSGEHFDIDEAPLIRGGRFMWNWGENYEHFAMLETSIVDDPNEIDATYTPESSEHVTTGRRRPMVTFGKTVHVEYTVHGHIVDGLKHSGETKAAFEALAHAGADGQKVTFRDGRGGICRVAISSITMNRKYDGLIDVDVSMVEVSD